MILRILGIMLAGVVILFVAYWIWNGGLSGGLKLGGHFDNPFTSFVGTSTDGTIRLPGQPDSLIDTIDIGEDGGTYSDGASTQEQLNALQARYDDLSRAAKDPRNFGNPSPYKDKIIFGLHNAQDSVSASEYVTLQAGYGNTAPISLAGWSLQSAVTGVRIMLPHAAPQFVSGVVNSMDAVSLSPGTTVYVISGPSPVGASFRENICSGYLGELQAFSPEIIRSCPLASDELPMNAQNISTFGDACVDFARTVQQCHFPGLDRKPDVNDACANFLLNRLSYNGCVYAHKNDSNFYQPTWRLYLGSGISIWRDTHDVVRLLDDQGRTVDVVSY